MVAKLFRKFAGKLAAVGAWLLTFGALAISCPDSALAVPSSPGISGAALSPAVGTIYFEQHDANLGSGADGTAFFSINPDGSGQRQIMTAPGGGEGFSVSPTGLMAWFLDPQVQGGATTIQIADSAGHVIHSVTTVIEISGYGSAVRSMTGWSPDGSKLLFTQQVGDGIYELWTVNADGTGLHKVVGTGWAPGSASWSPDSTKIGFGGANGLYVVNASGNADNSSDLTTLERGSNLGGDAFVTGSWSPDGNKIVTPMYLPNTNGGGGILALGLYDFGTKTLTKLEELASTNGGVNYPSVAFGPDSSRFAISSGTLSMVAIDGSSSTVLNAGGGSIWNGDVSWVTPPHSSSTCSSSLVHGAVTTMAAIPDQKGYYLVDSFGDIVSQGDAQCFGSLTGFPLSKGVVGMALTPDGKGYWLLGGDGGIFSFGAAQFFGSTGAMVLNKQVVGMLATPDGLGYWLVAADGGC